MVTATATASHSGGSIGIYTAHGAVAASATEIVFYYS